MLAVPEYRILRGTTPDTNTGVIVLRGAEFMVWAPKRHDGNEMPLPGASLSAGRFKIQNEIEFREFGPWV